MKASTTEEDENEEESVDMDVDKEKSVDDEIKEGKTGKAQSSNSANADGKSEYSRIRDANIAKNKKLLSDLGLLFPLGKGKDKATKKKGITHDQFGQRVNYKVKLGVSCHMSNLTTLLILGARRLPLARTLRIRTQALSVILSLTKARTPLFCYQYPIPNPPR